MRLTKLLFPAVLSLFLLTEDADAQRRPRYGGTLRVEVRERLDSLEAGSPWFDSVFETLVRLDSAGRPKPHLATAWAHDQARRRWVFTPRAGIKLHNGTPWSPLPSSLAFPDNRPIEQILVDLAQPGAAVIVRPPDGPPLGTGPFRISEWEPGRRLLLSAHMEHWQGRPFLDSVEIRLNRTHREQSQSFEIGQTDLIQLQLQEARRLRGQQVVLSPASTLLAVVSNKPIRALSQAIDRQSLHAILLQKQGEPAGALLPQSLSGIAFLFPVARDLAAAKAAAQGSPAISFFFDREDPVLRSIGERIILNAAEAGLVPRPAAAGASDARLVLLQITSANPQAALRELSLNAGLQPPPGDGLYVLEKALLDSGRIIPLLHLPSAFRLARRVQGWNPAPSWPLASTWLAPPGALP